MLWNNIACFNNHRQRKVVACAKSFKSVVICLPDRCPLTSAKNCLSDIPLNNVLNRYTCLHMSDLYSQYIILHEKMWE